MEGLRKTFAGLAERIKTTSLSEKDIDEAISQLELHLAANDVALEVIDKIANSLKNELRQIKVPRFGNSSDLIREAISKTIQGLVLESNPSEIVERVRENQRKGKATVILFVGPNGGGKTTTVVKIANYLRKNGFSSVIACSDTFRAGAIEQLRSLAERYGFWVVSQHYGADPAAVAVDAIRSAEARRIPVVLIDTAGRTEVDEGLLEEMRKIKRVTRPDFVIYVGDALSGNVAAEQARKFNEYVGIDYVILAKLDADAKGGSAISITQITGKPLIFVGVGQEVDDLDISPRSWILRALSLPA